MIGHHFSASVFTSAPSGDPKSEPPDVWRCYGASVASVAPVLAAAAEMFLGAWQHGIVGEYPVNLHFTLGFPEDCAKFSGGVQIPVGVDAEKSGE